MRRKIRIILPIVIVGIILLSVLLIFLTDTEEQTDNLSGVDFSYQKEQNNINNDNTKIEINALDPDITASSISQNQIISNNTISDNLDLESTQWSWIDPDNKEEVTLTAEQAFEQATNYVEGEKPRQLEALKMYQRVLDGNPTRLMELNVKLTMGARMMILYDPSLGEEDMYDEALKWYEQIVYDFNDLGNHTDMMTTKVCLGDLYCWNEYGIREAQKACDLCWEVINIPDEDFVFDDSINTGLNLDNIVKTVDNMIKLKVPSLPNGQSDQLRESIKQEQLNFLMQNRQEAINLYRLTAINSLITKQYIPGFPYEVNLERLLSLREERLDDQLFQETLEKRIQEFIESHEGIHSEFEEILEEGIEINNLQ